MHVPIPVTGDWTCVFASDSSLYDVSGSDLISVLSSDPDELSLNVRMAAYGAAIFVRRGDA